MITPCLKHGILLSVYINFILFILPDIAVSCTLQNNEADVKKKGCHWLYTTHDVCSLQDVASTTI